MHIYVYTLYVYIHTSYMHICTHTHIHIYTYMYMYTYMHIYFEHTLWPLQQCDIQLKVFLSKITTTSFLGINFTHTHIMQTFISWYLPPQIWFPCPITPIGQCWDNFKPDHKLWGAYVPTAPYVQPWLGYHLLPHNLHDLACDSHWGWGCH